MSLTCSCDSDWYPDPGDWYWDFRYEMDYEKYPFKRRRKCCSCGEMIDVGSLVLQFTRAKVPDTDIECKIYGEEGAIPIASDWMCEKCGDIYFSLEELGYCMNPRDKMSDLLRDYIEQKNWNENVALETN